MKVKTLCVCGTKFKHEEHDTNIKCPVCHNQYFEEIEEEIHEDLCDIFGGE